MPVCFTSAETGAGIPELLEVFARLAPNPTEGNPPPFRKGEGAAAVPVALDADAAKHVVGHVFKIVVDPFQGKLGWVRVHQGTIKTGAQLLVGHGRKPIKVPHLYRVQGKDLVEAECAVPGDLVAIPKVDELAFDAVLHDSHDEDHHHLQSVEFPPAMAGVAIEAEKRGDEQKISDALHRLLAEDPSARVEHVAHETVLYGQGDVHLRVMLGRMADRFGVHVKTRPPSIPYRETITKKAEGHHRHKKQTGGAGQFGEVYLRIEPLERGAGFEFVDAIVGGTIPGQFLPAIEKGVRHVLAEGAIAGFQLEDVRVVVYDGKYHAVDSKEVAFVAAGRKAFLEAVRAAAPVVLEPVVKLMVTAPSDAIGAVTGDVTQHRGRVQGSDSRSDGRTDITALVPLAELTDYPSRLKSITGGSGTFVLELAHYEAVPPRKQQELVAAFQPAKEED